MFQSTHPHGVRQRKQPKKPPLRSFNPRIRTGCDDTTPPTVPVLSGFNPRIRTGCDAASRSRSRSEQQFQSTHPHGVRLLPLLALTPQGFRTSKVRTSKSAYRKLDKNATENVQSLTRRGVRTSREFYGSLGFALLAAGRLTINKAR